MSAGRAFLALNASSSSLKFRAVRNQRASLGLTAKGEIENHDTAPHFVGRDKTGAPAPRDRNYRVSRACRDIKDLFYRFMS
jgi:acetate kinase